EKRAKLIGERSMRIAIPGDTEAAGTSHISIVDAQGNVASMTTTIEATFGSRIMVRGFLLNNELTDFDFTPGGPNIINYVAKSLVAMLDWSFDAQAAAAAPNFGSRNGPTLLESGSFYEA